MSNVTIALEDEVLQRAQRVAAEKHTTLDALVRDFLERLAREVRTPEEGTHARARQEILQMLGSFDVKVGSTPTRARTYAQR